MVSRSCRMIRMDCANVLGEVVFSPRRESTVADSALMSWLANAMDIVNVSGQVGARRESLRAFQAVPGSRMSSSVLSIWN
jgi:hypothetical protein